MGGNGGWCVYSDGMSIFDIEIYGDSCYISGEQTVYHSAIENGCQYTAMGEVVVTLVFFAYRKITAYAQVVLAAVKLQLKAVGVFCSTGETVFVQCSA